MFFFEEFRFFPFNEPDHLFQAFEEFGKILFVKEYFMPVVTDRSIRRRFLPALRNGKKIIVRTRSAHVQKIGPPAGFYDFRQDLFAEIFSVRAEGIQSSHTR